MMQNQPVDRFHQIFPDHGEPRLPIHTYRQLLECVDEDTAFDLLCKFEKGEAGMDGINAMLAANEHGM